MGMTVSVATSSENTVNGDWNEDTARRTLTGRGCVENVQMLWNFGMY